MSHRANRSVPTATTRREGAGRGAGRGGRRWRSYYRRTARRFRAAYLASWERPSSHAECHYACLTSQQQTQLRTWDTLASERRSTTTTPHIPFYFWLFFMVAIIFSSCSFFLSSSSSFMVALCNRADHIYFHLFLSSFFFLFFPRLISAVGDWMFGCLPYFGTWCGLSANLECRSEMRCTRLAANTGRKKSPSGHHRTTLSGHIFATKACIDNRKKIC